MHKTCHELRKNPNRSSAGGGMFHEKMTAGILLASLGPLKISRIIERRKMNLMALVQLLQHSQRANLSATISRVQKKRADPKNLHYRWAPPRLKRSEEHTSELQSLRHL